MTRERVDQALRDSPGGSHGPADGGDCHDPARGDSHDSARGDSHDPAPGNSHDPARGNSHDSAHHGPARGATVPLLGRLPAFYRENPEILEPLVDAAEEMLMDLRTALSRAEDHLERRIPAAWDRLLDRPEPLAAGLPLRTAGTAASLARWLQARFGAAPAVWAAMEVRSHPAGGVVLRSTRSPSAVVAWEKTAFPEAPEDISIPEDLLPAGVPVQAVVLARMPHGKRPRNGERVPGDIVWSRPGTARDGPGAARGEAG